VPGSTSLWKDYVRASIMRDWDDPRYGLGFTFGAAGGYFEGIDGERGIAWRVADSLALRRFLRIGLNERTPQPLRRFSRTGSLIDVDTHREVFCVGAGR